MTDKKNPEAATSGLNNKNVDGVTVSGIDSTTPDTSATAESNTVQYAHWRELPVTPGGLIEWLHTIDEREPTPVPEPVTRTYAELDAAGVFHRSLGDLLPLATRLGKTPPALGGIHGAKNAANRLDDAARARYADHVGNVAGVPAPNVLMVDIDGLLGWTTIATYEVEYGPIADSQVFFVSSRRGSPHHGGHVVMLAPTGVDDVTYDPTGDIGPGVEIVDVNHRYSVTSGSTYPVDADGYKTEIADKTGQTRHDPTLGYLTYMWMGTDGSPREASPTADELPHMTWDWFQKVVCGRKQRGSRAAVGHASNAEAEDFVALIAADTRSMCPRVREKLDIAVEAFQSAPTNGHDEATMSGTLSIAATCAAGHSGFEEASEVFRSTCVDHYGNDVKFEDKMSRALQKVAAEHDGEYHPRRDGNHSCDGSIDFTGWGLDGVEPTDTVTDDVADAAPHDETTSPSLAVPVPPGATPAPAPAGTGAGAPETVHYAGGRWEDEAAERRQRKAAADREQAVIDGAVADIAGQSSTYTGEGPESFADKFALKPGPDYDPKIFGDPEKIIKALKKKSKNDTMGKSYADFSVIFCNDPDLSMGCTSTLSGQRMWTGLPSWRKKGDNDTASLLVTGADMNRVVKRVRLYYGGFLNSVSETHVLDAWEDYVTHANRMFAPFKAYVAALPSPDGSASIERPITNGAVADDAYTRGVFRDFFIGIILRTFFPGEDCTVDTMPVFFGKAGTRKTSWGRSIAAGIPGVMAYKTIYAIPSGDEGAQTRIQLHNCVIGHADELDTFTTGKKGSGEWKAFMSAPEDYERAKYAKDAERMFRHYVMFGTTNTRGFLSAEAGERRYRPIEILDVISAADMTREHFDQLLAEARDLVFAGEGLNETKEFQDLCEEYRQSFTSDPVGDLLDEFFEDPKDAATRRPVDISKVRVEYLIDHIAKLDAKRLGMTPNTLRTKVAAYVDARPDYEFRKKTSFKNAQGRLTQQRNVWVRTTPTTQTGPTVVAQPDGTYGVPAPAPAGFPAAAFNQTTAPQPAAPVAPALNTVTYDEADRPAKPAMTPSEHAQRMTEARSPKSLGLYQTPPPPTQDPDQG